MWVMIRYRLKPDQVQPNLELLNDYFAELDTGEPPDEVSEAVFQLEDGVSFVHFGQTSDAGLAWLRRSPTFQRYRTTLDERCDEPPELTLLGKQIHSHRLP